MLRPILCVTALLAATTTTLDHPRYAPGEAPLRRTVSMDHATEFESMRVVMGGQEVPGEYLPVMEMLFEGKHRLVVTDRIEGVSDGRPLVLVRSFEEFEAFGSADVSVSGIVEDQATSEGSSRLLGKTVSFAWDEDAGAFEASFDEEGDEELLDGLVEDLDLRVLLPEEGVAVGDSWDIDGEDCGFFLAPGGDLSIDWETPGDWERSTDAEMGGSLVVVWEGVDDGIALFTVEGELETVQVQATDLELVPVADGTATETTTTTFIVQGRVHWSLEAGRLVDAEFTADTTAETLTVRDEEQEGPAYEHSMVMVGTHELLIEIERAD